MNESILIPMMRTLIPQMLATELVNVQPMTLDSARLQPYDEPFNLYPYVVHQAVDIWDLGFKSKALVDMYEWCDTTLQAGSWHYLQGRFSSVMKMNVLCLC